MNPETLPEHAEAPFRFLFEEHGARVLRTNKSPYLGDWYADVESDGLCIRLGEERGQNPFVDVSSSHTAPERFDLGIVAELILGPGASTPSSLQDTAAFMQRHYSTLADLFSKEKAAETARRLLDLQHQRAMRMFPEWFKEPDSSLES